MNIQGKGKASKQRKKVEKKLKKCLTNFSQNVIINYQINQVNQRKELMIMKKMTKKEMFAEVIAVVERVEVENKAEMLNFLAHEVELLNKKSSKSGQTKTQKENVLLMEQLVVALSEMEEPVTISEFQAKSTSEVATLSNQKLSALLKKLVEENKVVKTVEKKKSYFSIV